MKQNLFLAAMILLLLTSNVIAQIVANVQVAFTGPIQYVVTDSQGERCGYNPITNRGYDEIPYAGYGDDGEGNLDSNATPTPVWAFGFNTLLFDTLFSTTYTIQLFGTGRGTFVGDCFARQTRSGNGKGGRFHVEGVVDSNQTVSYVFNYSTDSTITPTFMKVVTPRIIFQDFKDCFKLKLLGDKEFFTELRNQLDNFDRHIDRKDSIEARRELEGFWNRIRLVYSDTVNNDSANHHAETRFDHRRRGFVTQEAYQILNEDVNLMLAQLPDRHGRGDEEEHRGKK